MRQHSVLEKVTFPEDIKKLSLTELETLAGEIREEMIETVSRNGGHLASSLGTVELTLAIHYVFNTPKDKLLWDVAIRPMPTRSSRAERTVSIPCASGAASADFPGEKRARTMYLAQGTAAHPYPLQQA
jgi:hypothetical protein